MTSSLTARFTRTLFFLVTANTAISIFVIDLLVGDAENTILELELKADSQFFVNQLKQGNFQPIKTARLEAFFLADGESASRIPAYFQTHPPPYSLETEVDGATLLIYGQQLEELNGTLFVAQDITIMENQEFLIQLVLFSVTGSVLLVGFIIAGAGARYLLRPFNTLTQDVSGTAPGPSMRKITTDYRDQEFYDIAQAFNRFLSELESHIEREKLFVKLASHELRTPLAVMSGALDVLEQRQSLSAADEKTFARVRRSLQVMRDDTDVLLELARSEAPGGNISTTVVLQDIIQATVDDLEHGRPEHAGRIAFQEDDQQVSVTTHPALLRMLLRNLLQNALRHTHASVEIRIDESSISVCDHGPGLPDTATELLSVIGMKNASASGSATFGLLIVRLVCERLHWNLEIAKSDSEGSEIVIHFKKRPTSGEQCS